MNKSKKIIISIGTIATLVGGSQIPIDPAPLTVNEWQEVTQLYNYEIQQAGGEIQVQNFGKFEDLNTVIRKRVPNESVEVSGQVKTAKEYEAIRESLLKKVEKRTVLEAIIK